MVLPRPMRKAAAQGKAPSLGSRRIRSAVAGTVETPAAPFHSSSRLSYLLSILALEDFAETNCLRRYAMQVSWFTMLFFIAAQLLYRSACADERAFGSDGRFS